MNQSLHHEVQGTSPHLANYRQRFFVEHSPVRGDVVRLSTAYQTVIAQKAYPSALQALIGEMLVAASLLIGTLKIDGRISIQLQGDGTTKLHWAMAECDHTGAVRALADFDPDGWDHALTSDDAFAQLGAHDTDGVLFISIHPERGESYQGIVERVSGNLGECLAHYQKQSAQIDTLIHLAADASGAGGIILQKLPQSTSDADDPDLWGRLTLLASTLKSDELTTLPAEELLYRLYHEEQIILPDVKQLDFGCTCSAEKSASAIIQLGKVDALTIAKERGEIALDCGFCGQVYRFDPSQVAALFA